MNYNGDDACSSEPLEGAASGEPEHVGPGDHQCTALDHAGHAGDADILLPMMNEEATISGKPFPARPNTIKYVHIAKTHTNHSYRDFTCMPMEPNYTFPGNVEQMTFHERLYHLLTLDTAQRRLAIDWCCHGRAFHILNVEYLEHLGILRCYFGFSSVQRLRKQFNNYGYKLLVRASSSECYYSEVSSINDIRHRSLI